MSGHAPKVAALLAYRAGSLSAAGRRRIEQHLDGCTSCCRTLAAIDVHDELASDVRRGPTPRLDWSRMELTLRREARTQARGAQRRVHRGILLGGAVAAAAVTLAVISALPRPTSDRGSSEATAAATGPAPRPDTPAGEAVAEPLEGEVTAVSGTVLARRGASADAELRPLTVGDPLRSGTALTSGERAAVHVRIADGTGLVAHGSTRLEIAELTDRTMRLELEAGSISNEVAPLAPGTRYEVRAGRWEVRVHGTRFLVTREGDALEVRVEEGVVEVRRDGERVELVHAPGQFRSTPGPTTEEGRPIRHPRALSVSATSWPSLSLPALERVERWEVDGTAFEVAGRLALRIPAGAHTILAHGARGEPEPIEVNVPPEGATLQETDLAGLVDRLRGPVQGTLAPEVIQPVLAEAQPALRRCQERAMRHRPDLAGAYQLRVRVTVGLSGKVRRAHVRAGGTQPPPELVDCIVQELERRAFPRPVGGPVTFELPLRFQPR